MPINASEVVWDNSQDINPAEVIWDNPEPSSAPPVNLKSKKALGTFQEQMLQNMIDKGRVGGTPDEVKAQQSSAKEATGLGGAVDRASNMNPLSAAMQLPRFAADTGAFFADSGLYGLKALTAAVRGGGKAIRSGMEGSGLGESLDQGAAEYNKRMEGIHPGRIHSPFDPSEITNILSETLEPVAKAIDTSQADPELSSKLMAGLGLAGIRGKAGTMKLSDIPKKIVNAYDNLRPEGPMTAPDLAVRTAESALDKVTSMRTPEATKKAFNRAAIETMPPKANKAKTGKEREAHYAKVNEAFDEMLNQEGAGVIQPFDPGKTSVITELSERIPAAKDAVFKEYDALQKATTGQGVTASPESIAQLLEKDATSPGAKEFKGYDKAVVEEAARLREEGPLNAEQLQEKIKALNAEVQSPQHKSAPYNHARIQEMKLMAYRAMIQDMVMSATGEQYAPLKAKYGALVEHENNVANLVNKADKRAGGSHLSPLDLMAVGEMGVGITKLNPALITSSLAIEALSMARKALTSPNARLAKMYRLKKAHHVPREIGATEFNAPEQTPLGVPTGEGGNWGAGAVDPLRNGPQDLSGNRTLPARIPVNERGFQRAGVDYPIEGEVIPPVKPAGRPSVTVEGQVLPKELKQIVNERGFQRAGVDYPIEGEVIPPVKPAGRTPVTVEGQVLPKELKQIEGVMDPRLGVDHTWEQWQKAEESGNQGDAHFWRGKFEEAVRREKGPPPK